MERFLASLSNELFKLRKRKKYLVFLIIGAVICVASALRVLIVNYITDGGVSREAILGGLVFTGYLRWHNLWIGIALPFFSLLPRIGLLAGYGLVFGCCGYLLFDRKEA